jgi:hypothetical protein
MRKIIDLTGVVLCTVLLLSASATAQTSTFRDQLGRETGSASTVGGVTTYRDRLGRETGTAERRRDGSIQFRDAQGRLIGSSTAPRR